jgi:hypothetical protein
MRSHRVRLEEEAKVSRERSGAGHPHSAALSADFGLNPALYLRRCDIRKLPPSDCRWRPFTLVSLLDTKGTFAFATSALPVYEYEYASSMTLLYSLVFVAVLHHRTALHCIA